MRGGVEKLVSTISGKCVCGIAREATDGGVIGVLADDPLELLDRERMARPPRSGTVVSRDRATGGSRELLTVSLESPAGMMCLRRYRTPCSSTWPVASGADTRHFK